MQVGFADTGTGTAGTVKRKRFYSLRLLNRWPWCWLVKLFKGGNISQPRSLLQQFSQLLFQSSQHFSFSLGFSVTVPRTPCFTNISTSKAAAEPHLETISHWVCDVSCCAVPQYPLLCLAHHLYSQWSFSDVNGSRIML